MTDDLTSSQQFLEQARIALHYNDRQAARRLVQQSIQSDHENRDAWLLMAELSHGSAKIAYLEQADRSSSSTSRLSYTPEFNKHVEEKPLDSFMRSELSNSGNTGKQDSADKSVQPIQNQKVKRSILLSVLVATILLSTILVFLLVWISSPTPIVSAIDHSSQRMAGELLKPSLTPTNTPEPTITPIDTFTPEPTVTAAPELTEMQVTQHIITIPAPEIPLNIAEDERWIDVDLTHQQTYAFEGSTLIRTFIVSTGTQYHPTIIGQYHIYVKYRYTDMAGPGYYLPDVPYTMYFYKGYSLHGTYWHDNFGQPMSHGCINMTIPDSEWLFYWASVGTLVNIHY